MPVVGLLPIWVLLYAWALEADRTGDHAARWATARRSIAAARAATAPPVLAASAASSTTARCSRRSRSSRTRHRSSTPARALRREGLRQPEPARRTAPRRVVERIVHAATRREVRRRPHGLARSWRRSATSATRSPAPTRSTPSTPEFTDWCAPEAPNYLARSRTATRPWTNWASARHRSVTGVPVRRMHRLSGERDVPMTERSPARRPRRRGRTGGRRGRYWLARHGHDVTVSSARVPREKTCGDGLTPRRSSRSSDMGLGEELLKFHRFGAAGDGRGPHPRAAVAVASVVPVLRLRGAPARARRDGRRRTPRSAGATLLARHRGVDADRRAGLRARRGRAARRRRPSPTRCGPATSWSPTARTAGSAGRSARSARRSGHTARPSARTGRARCHDEPWIESALDVKDRNGNPLPGYGWIFPVGDGTVNIGVGLLSTFRDFKSVNTTHLLDAYAHMVADRWGIDPDQPTCKPTSGRIPMGGLGRSEGGPDLPRRRRRGRQRQPVQRRGHRLRLRDRPPRRRHPPRGARSTTTHSSCSATRSCSTTSTASTSRWPGCSPGSSAGRR